jgi:hypothetical protein
VTTRTLVWFGLIGGPAAWLLHLLVGYSLDEIACSSGTPTNDYWGAGVEPLIAVVTVALAAVAVAAETAAVLAWRAIETGRYADPRGRLGFLAFAAVISNVTFLAIIVLGGVQLVELGPCHR